MRSGRSGTMPTAVELPEPLCEHDFTDLARRALDGRVRVRLLALAHLQEGKTPRDIGAMLKVHEKTVLKWIRRYRARGVEGMAEQPGRGGEAAVEGRSRAGVEGAPCRGAGCSPGRAAARRGDP